MSLIPVPTSLDMARRWVCETRGETASGRRLTSATISSGGLSIAREGSLVVDGDLRIVDGDLILGGGVIQGDALKEHVWPQMVARPQASLLSQRVTGRGKWAVLDRISFPVPPWAEKAIIYANCQYSAMPDINKSKTSLTGMVRIRTSRRKSPEMYVFSGMLPVSRTITFPTVESVTASSGLDVVFEHWLADVVLSNGHYACSVLVIWLST